MITLGVDVGTTRTKVLALDVDSGRSLALETVATPSLEDAWGQARRPTDVLDTVVDLVGRVTRSLAVPAEVAAISCASVGEEVVLLGRDGRPVADVIAWYDPRGLVEAAAFSAGPGAGLQLWADHPPDPSFSLFKLLWMHQHASADLARADAWTDLGDYVLLGLGGELVMDWSHASRAGAFDLRRRAWDDHTIRASGLAVGFPRLVASGTVIGRIDEDVARSAGLPPTVSIVTGGHDHLCAAYGAGLRSTADCFVSAGTSEAHLALLASPMPGPVGRYRLDQGCFVDGRSYYAHLAMPSGHVFRQWRSLLYAEAEDDAMYAEIGTVVAGAGGVTFTLADDLRHGRLDRVPWTADRAVVMRAILEGLARHSAEIVAGMEGSIGSAFESIMVTGQATRVPLWRDIRAAAYARPMVVVGEMESAALGAALIAARAVRAAP